MRKKSFNSMKAWLMIICMLAGMLGMPITVYGLELDDAAIVAADKEALTIGFAAGDSADSVTGNLTLVTTGDSLTVITWQSDTPEVIAHDGAVTRPDAGGPDAEVTLTATITYGAASDTKEFTVMVRAEEETGLHEGARQVLFDRFSEMSALGSVSLAIAQEAGKKISAGPYHSLALKADGAVAAWGTTSYGMSSVPEGLDHVVAIAAGTFHSLALKADGTVVAWGRNDYNQCVVPVGLADVVAIDGGANHSLALKADGTVTAWGRNTDNQCRVPVGLANVVAIAARANHCLALKADGTVAAWGRYDQSDVPDGLANVVAITAGYSHCLALKADGIVVAWGTDSSGQCIVPGDLDNVVAIAGGTEHSLALKADGAVVAWGGNSDGQCDVPEGLDDVVAIAAGGAHCLALRADGTVTAWGYNEQKQSDVPYGLNLGGRLSSLEVGPGFLEPAFQSDTGAYTLKVPFGAAGVEIRAAQENPAAVLRVNDQETTSGDTVTVSLEGGLTVIPIEVATAADGLTRTYALTVNRFDPARGAILDPSAELWAGIPFDLAVSIVDTTGDTITAYSGTISFSSSDPEAQLPAAYTFTAGDCGVKVFNDVVISQAGPVTLGVSGPAIDPDGCWKFDEDSGAAAPDSSANGNHAALYNTEASVWSPDAPAVSFTNPGGLLLDGTDDYGEISGVDLAGKSFTISFWAKNTKAGESFVLSTNTPQQANKNLHIGFLSPTSFTFAFHNNDLSAAATDDGDWHHWTLTYDISTGKRIIYRDGVNIAENTSAVPLQATGPLHIGRRYNNTGSSFQGGLDDLRIYYQALPESVVQRLAAGIEQPEWWREEETFTVGLPPHSIAASAASLGPVAGSGNTITLTAKKADGTTETAFTGSKNVTLSGYTAAPDSSYGSFNGSPLSASPHTVSVAFTNGVATPNLVLHHAASQTIGFRIGGVLNPQSNNLVITPLPAAAAAMTLSRDILAPAANGGQFARQPQVTLQDAYGNFCANDSDTTITASKKDTGAWVLTGTTTAGASAGVVTFSDLGAANMAAMTGAQLAFDAPGLAQITGETVDLSANTAAQSLKVTAAPGDIIAGVPFAVTVEALDVNNSRAAGYRGTVVFSSTDLLAVLPGAYTFTPADNGVKTFTVTLNTGGDQSLTVTSAAEGMEGYWQFDEGTGDAVRDSFRNHHGIIKNTVAGVWTGGAPAIIFPNSHGVQFNGSNYIEIPPGVDLASKPFGISFWAQRSRSDIQEWIVSQGSAAVNQGFQIGFQADNAFCFGFFSDDLNIPAASYVNDTQWHHWMLTYDAVTKTQRVFQDGVLRGTRIAGNHLSASGDLYIGKGFEDDYFAGGVDDLQVYYRLLSAEEIGALAIGGAMAPCGKAVLDVLPVTLQSIAITTSPTKTLYYVGQDLDLTGLAVTGTYNDGSTRIETVTAAEVSGFDSSAPADDQVLTITVGGKTATFTVDILPVLLESITITTLPTKLVYYVGQDLDLTGLVVTGTYNDGSTRAETVTAAEVSGFDSSVPADDQVLTVTVGSKTATFTVDILPVLLESIAITSPPTKTVYYVGQDLDLTGLLVTGTYNDGSNRVETVTVADISGFDSSAPVDDQVLTVTMGGKTATFTVDIAVYSSGSGRRTPSPPSAVMITIDAKGNISAPPRLDQSIGVAAVNIDISTLDTALARAGEGSDGRKRIEIAMSAVEGATAYETTLPASALTSSGADTRLAIKTGIADVTLPGNMLAQTDAETASLTIARADISGIDAETRKLIGDRPVIQLSLAIDGKQTVWDNPESPVAVSIPYTPTAAELADPEHITVWYIDGAGNVVEVPSGRYDPVTGTVTFSTTHFSRYAVTYVQKTFGDLGTVEWARKAVEVLASKGVLRGIAEAKYDPQAHITRADFLYFLVRTLGVDARVNGNFDDISRDAYYYEEIGIARALGITGGTGNNRFTPDEGISRQDMMVLTERALRMLDRLEVQGSAADLERFSDKPLIADYAVDSVASVVKAGLIVGSGGGINPLGHTARAEAAVFLYRIYN